VGLDVHKDTIAVALVEARVRGDVREYGKVEHADGVEGSSRKARATRERASVLP
jgi:hypothetical protein